ncbi:MAG: hypothetical protein EO766_18080, partial [Hydrotalea sp. AMD]
MAKRKAPIITDKNPAHWVRLKGDTTRNYVNTKTGEIISRRQYDEKIGRLSKEGLTNETQAKKNKAENPIAFSAKPRRGKKKGAELKQYEKEIKKNKVELKHKDGYLTKFVVSPINSVTVAEAFQAIAQIPKARSYRRIITMRPKDGGAEITTATPYNNI